jgi:hypothetical protein
LTVNAGVMFLRPFLVLALMSATVCCHAQDAKDFMFGAAMDLAKTDYEGLLKKAQFSAEGHYFITRAFSASAGFDVWTGDSVSFVAGGRWYPMDNFFTRVRGLIGENDLSLGAGWNQNISDRWRFEAMADFYFKGEFAMRAGLMYVVRHR